MRSCSLSVSPPPSRSPSTLVVHLGASERSYSIQALTPLSYATIVIHRLSIESTTRLFDSSKANPWVSTLITQDSYLSIPDFSGGNRCQTPTSTSISESYETHRTASLSVAPPHQHRSVSARSPSVDRSPNQRQSTNQSKFRSRFPCLRLQTKPRPPEQIPTP